MASTFTGEHQGATYSIPTNSQNSISQASTVDYLAWLQAKFETERIFAFDLSNANHVPDESIHRDGKGPF
jgi:hypothetical protein